MPGHRILVVEDNPLNLKLVRDVLVASGFEVETAVTGEDAVTLAEGRPPDLVLMDIQLPGIDGYETLRLLRLNQQLVDVPAIAVTAFAMREDRERTTLEGFDGYIGKPISVPSLAAQVSAFLDQGRTRVR